MTGLATALVLVASNMWPAYSYHLWGAFIAVTTMRLYRDLREPVNYESIAVAPGGIEYVAFGMKRVVAFDEVVTLSFVRESFGDSRIESKWFFRMADGSGVEIVDEWPHRRFLVRVFLAQLPQFDVRTARAGIRAWGEGQWVCYRAPRLSHGA